MKFTVEIALGNDAMQTAADALNALEAALERSDIITMRERLADGDDGTIRDTNGNTVGKWQVVS